MFIGGRVLECPVRFGGTREPSYPGAGFASHRGADDILGAISRSPVRYDFAIDNVPQQIQLSANDMRILSELKNQWLVF